MRGRDRPDLSADVYYDSVHGAWKAITVANHTGLLHEGKYLDQPSGADAEIEEFTAPVNVRKFFLWVGALLGTICVALSKVLKYSGLEGFMPVGLSEFMVDIVFEIGVALIGAAVTAAILEILLNEQQKSAMKWRAEMWRRIGGREAEEQATPVLEVAAHASQQEETMILEDSDDARDGSGADCADAGS
jgi:hypothetical protein